MERDNIAQELVLVRKADANVGERNRIGLQRKALFDVGSVRKGFEALE